MDFLSVSKVIGGKVTMNILGMQKFLFNSLPSIFPPVCPLCQSPMILQEKREMHDEIPQQSAFCFRCKAEFPPLKADEAIRVIHDHHLSWSPSRYNNSTAFLLRQCKFHGFKSHAPALAGYMAQAFLTFLKDCPQLQTNPILLAMLKKYKHLRLPREEDIFLVLPLPLHPKREKERGYNQSAELARVFAKKIGGYYVDTLLQRVKYTEKQTEQVSVEARKRNVHQVFGLHMQEVERLRKLQEQTNKHFYYLLLDDVITTGATMEEALSSLEKAFCLPCMGISFASLHESKIIR